jgi:hypothetical protein
MIRMRINFTQAFNKEDLITGSIILMCLFLYAFFPTRNIFQQVVCSLTFLLVIPFLYVKIILKKSIKDFGFKTGSWTTGIFWSVVSILISASIAYIIFKYFGFSEKYPFPRYFVNNFVAFLIYEIMLVGLFAFLYDVFFRGFLMFSFKKKIGLWSILLQASVFMMFFFLSGTLSWKLIPEVIFLFFSGIIAYFSNSIFYSFVAYLCFNIIFDSLFIYAIR